MILSEASAEKAFAFGGLKIIVSEKGFTRSVDIFNQIKITRR